MRKFPRVGILGGGQLSLMLADAGTRLGLRPLIFAANESEPACKKYPHVIGRLDDELALQTFFSELDVVIFENEFVDCAILEKASQKYDIAFSPRLETISLLQDKLKQKHAFDQLGIASPSYIKLELGEKLKDSLRLVHDTFGPCILKWSRMGYDGKGVLYFDHSRSSIEGALVFCAKAVELGSEVYAEEFIAFKRELAAIGVYSRADEFLSYPVVVSEQENSVCSRVFGPASQLGLNHEQEENAKSYVEKIGRTLQLFGAFALEMFETRDGRILANEIAPRVHNSGHYTQDACQTDQFENHWHAVLEEPLGTVNASAGFAMLNFLGPDNLPSAINRERAATHVPRAGKQSVVHWYGKTELRSRRKMGHINGRVDNFMHLVELLAEMENAKSQWISQIKGESAAYAS